MATSSKDVLEHALGSVPHNAEARRRATVSRAYYAVFHRCREWVRTLPRLAGSKQKSHGMHQQLIDRLADPPDACSRQKKALAVWLSERLLVMRERRVTADYRLQERVTEDDMRAQQREAQELFNRCDGRRKP